MDNFQDIISFAIDREHEAAKFYREMQTKVRHESSRKFFRELEMMELGHAKTLAAFKSENISSSFEAPKILDMQISDYMDDIEPHDKMTFQEVLIIAMKREEAAVKLYNNLADHIADEHTKNIFLHLAGEEAKHKNQLETVYDDEILKEN